MCTIKLNIIFRYKQFSCINKIKKQKKINLFFRLNIKINAEYIRLKFFIIKMVLWKNKTIRKLKENRVILCQRCCIRALQTNVSYKNDILFNNNYFLKIQKTTIKT